MQITLSKALVQEIGAERLKPYDVDANSFTWRKEWSIELDKYSRADTDTLLTMVRQVAHVRGSKAVARDIETWLAAVDGATDVKPRTVRAFEATAWQVMSRVPGHRLYKKDSERDVWHAFYVNEIEYQPLRSGTGWRDPEHVDVELLWLESAGEKKETLKFYREACVGVPTLKAFLDKGYIVETEDLRREYLERTAAFHDAAGHVGRQYLATGVGTDDTDDDTERTWWRRQTRSLLMDKDGVPSRVVIDVFRESDEKEESNKSNVQPYYWTPKSDDDQDQTAPDVEVPVHPLLVCFDLKRQKRLRLDIGQLTEYQYDATLGDKLVLPSDSRDLINILLAHRTGFTDIIANKGGGAIILCAGLPGTGKTLTAEVYAEVTQRPLYSVQASQLGVTPEELEDELLKVLSRASRWNAILLLDEADVYVAARGSDLQQNAIVGVFLRVLEYYKSILFLTTNRADLVDDAVASRCIARIDYTVPTVPDQKKIWRILATAAGATISDITINQVAAHYPDLSGRDVKNLLKLAKLVSESRGTDITLDIIHFVKRFKPTGNNAAPPVVLSDEEDAELDEEIDEDTGYAYNSVCLCGHKYGAHGGTNDQCLWPEGFVESKKCLCTHYAPARQEDAREALRRRHQIKFKNIG